MRNVHVPRTTYYAPRGLTFYFLGVALIAQGLSNPAIAEQLIISVGTIKAHTNRIYGKLGATNRIEAVNKAQELSLLADKPFPKN